MRTVNRRKQSPNGVLNRSPEAERALLGCVLHDPAAMERLSTLVADDFGGDAERRVWQAMLALQHSGQPIDVVTLGEELHKQKAIEDIGGYGFIAELVHAATTAAHTDSYAQIIRDRSIKRRLREVEGLTDRFETGEEALAELRTLLASIDASRPATRRFPQPVPSSLLARDLPTARWIWDGYIGRGIVTMLSSLWKAGKSTLIALLVKAMEMGGTLAGRSVQAGGALIVSEENQTLWGLRRDKLNLGDHCLFYNRLFKGRPSIETWNAFIQHLASLVKDEGLSLVCIDTLSAISPCDDENDAAKMMQALAPLHLVTEAGAGILLNHHPKKGDAGEGQAARGSGSLPGFVDVILEMRRTEPADRGNRQRVLTAYSRFEETPDELVIELNTMGTDYIAVGSRADAQQQNRTKREAEIVERSRQAILGVLPSFSDGCTVTQASNAAGLSRGEKFAPALSALLKDGIVEHCMVTVKCGRGSREIEGIRLTGTPGHTGTIPGPVPEPPGTPHRDTVTTTL